MKSVFLYGHYKDFLRGRWQKERGAITKAAHFLECQRSYLSRILSEDFHLTMDHAYKLCDYFHFSEREREYFLLLVERDRAGYHAYRGWLDRRIRDIQKEQEDLKNRGFKPAAAMGDANVEYFSSWIYSLIHFLTACPDFQTTAALSRRTQLPGSAIENVLKGLERAELVRQVGKRWVFASGDLHLGKGHWTTSLHHHHWRQRALMNAAIPDTESLHFTSIQSASSVDIKRLRQKILDWIQELNSIAHPSVPEDVFCFNCDFFVP